MAANDVSKAADELKADIESLKTDVSALMQSLGKLAGDSGREGLRTLEEAKARVQAQASESAQTVERQIVEKPLLSVLIAFAAGMLFGKLLDRR